MSKRKRDPDTNYWRLGDAEGEGVAKQKGSPANLFNGWKVYNSKTLTTVDSEGNLKDLPPSNVRLSDLHVGNLTRLFCDNRIESKILIENWPADFSREGAINATRRNLGEPYLILGDEDDELHYGVAYGYYKLHGKDGQGPAFIRKAGVKVNKTELVSNCKKNNVSPFEVGDSIDKPPSSNEESAEEFAQESAAETLEEKTKKPPKKPKKSSGKPSTKPSKERRKETFDARYRRGGIAFCNRTDEDLQSIFESIGSQKNLPKKGFTWGFRKPAIDLSNENTPPISNVNLSSAERDEDNRNSLSVPDVDKPATGQDMTNLPKGQHMQIMKRKSHGEPLSSERKRANFSDMTVITSELVEPIVKRFQAPTVKAAVPFTHAEIVAFNRLGRLSDREMLILRVAATYYDLTSTHFKFPRLDPYNVLEAHNDALRDEKFLNESGGDE